MEETAAEAVEPGWIETALSWSPLGFEVWRLAAAGMLIYAAYRLRRTIAGVMRRWMDYGAQRTETQLDDEVGEALEEPLELLGVALAVYGATHVLALVGSAGEIAQSLVTTLFAASFFWAVLRLTPLFGKLLRKTSLTPELCCWAERISRVAIWLVAVATILEIWGIRVAPIIAGFGLLGVAVALGAQDLFKNLISGALVLTEKRFRVGDWIKIDGVVEGTVEAINFRSTKVRRFDKAPVYVPNRELADGAVTNFGEMTHRRIFWRVGLEYRSSAEQLSSIRSKVETFIREDGRFLVPPDGTLLVRIDQFADSSIDLLIYCFTKTRDWADWLAIKEELLLFVKKTVEDAGTGIAFPSRTLYVESGAETPALEAPSKPAPKAAAKPAAKSAAKSTRGASRTRKAPTTPKAKPAAKSTAKAKAADQGPDDGPIDGLSDAPEDEGAGPAAAQAS